MISKKVLKIYLQWLPLTPQLGPRWVQWHSPPRCLFDPRQHRRRPSHHRQRIEETFLGCFWQSQSYFFHFSHVTGYIIPTNISKFMYKIKLYFRNFATTFFKTRLDSKDRTRSYLMDKDIFIGIIAMDKSVAVTDIEPLYLTGNMGSQDFAWFLLKFEFILYFTILWTDKLNNLWNLPIKGRQLCFSCQLINQVIGNVCAVLTWIVFVSFLPSSILTLFSKCFSIVVQWTKGMRSVPFFVYGTQFLVCTLTCAILILTPLKERIQIKHIKKICKLESVLQMFSINFIRVLTNSRFISINFGSKSQLTVSYLHLVIRPWCSVGEHHQPPFLPPRFGSWWLINLNRVSTTTQGSTFIRF